MERTVFSNPNIFDGVEPNGRLTRGTVAAMVAAIPPGTPLTREAVSEALRRDSYYQVLIDARIDEVMALIAEKTAHVAHMRRAVG
jgi:hypothetical protein